MPTRTSEGDYKVLTICIDSYQNDAPVGTLYHPCLPEGEGFFSLSQLLLKMERALGTSPESRSLTRFFSSPQPSVPMSDAPPGGKRATFFVRILFRSNASWQGSVTWLEGRREESFRSVLELILLLYSALHDKKDPS